MTIGVVVEKRSALSRWTGETWRTIAVIPGSGSAEPGCILETGSGWTRYYAGHLELTLHRSGTAGYRQNLSAPEPLLYVVLRPRNDDRNDAMQIEHGRDEPGEGRGVEPFLVTACPFEAQDYLDSGEETVDAVRMPPPVAAWVQAFLDRHHVDEPFVKRKQKPKSGSFLGGGRHAR
ncbi:MAG: DUF3305 domain-containing protein [Rhodospirillales bacterium]|nr:DUF3305 domain-containing protein [Rhodospirillales bacterium]